MGKGYCNSIKKIKEIAGNRELIFWGTDYLSQYVYDDLLDMGYDIKYFVSEHAKQDTEVHGKQVKLDIELFYENKENIFVVAFVVKNHGNIYQRLTDMGFVFEKDFLLYGFGGYIQKFDVIDSLLGYNRYYGDMLGFKISGSEERNTYKILILGGSTTDPTMGNQTPWAEYLYQKLISVQVDVMVINGGMAGYSTYQEFYKFVRDGLLFAPDMLITYDGLNDVTSMAMDKDYPMLMPYARKVYDNIEKKGDFAPDTLEIRNASRIVHGLKQTNQDDAGKWMDNIRKIHAIAEEFGVLHIGFFQPMLKTGKAIISKRQKVLIETVAEELPVYNIWMDGMEEFYGKVLPFLDEKGYMNDLTSIFDGKENIYYDFCHATDIGNAIIADAVYHTIMPYIKKGGE